MRENIYFAAHGGEIYRYLQAKIVRTDQADGSGLAVEGTSVAPCPKLKRHTQKLVKKLNYTGIGCAQFLIDKETDRISFLEINPRIAGNHAVPEACNLALGDCLIDLSEGRSEMALYREGTPGVTYSWLAGELDAIKRSWKSGELTMWQAFTTAYFAVSRFKRCDLDVGFPKGDRLSGIFPLFDSLPLVGGLTRLRLQSPSFFRFVMRKEFLR